MLLGTTALQHVAAQIHPIAVATGITLSGTAGAVMAAWTASPGATSYRVQRAAGPTAAYVDLGHVVTTTSMLDTSALAGATYYYEVVSFFPAGAKSTSAPVAYTVPSPARIGLVGKPTVGTRPVVAQAARRPTGFHAAYVGPGTVQLSWDALPGALSFRLTGTGVAAAGISLSAGAASVTLHNLPAGTANWSLAGVFSAGGAPGAADWATTNINIRQ